VVSLAGAQAVDAHGDGWLGVVATGGAAATVRRWSLRVGSAAPEGVGDDDGVEALLPADVALEVARAAATDEEWTRSLRLECVALRSVLLFAFAFAFAFAY